MDKKLLILQSFAFTLDSLKYVEAERIFQEKRSANRGQNDGTTGTLATTTNLIQLTNAQAPTGDHGATTTVATSTSLSLVEQVAKAREHIQAALGYKSTGTTPTSFLPPGGVSSDDPAMREENALLKKKVELLENQVKELTVRVGKLEVECKAGPVAPPVCSIGVKPAAPVPLPTPTPASGDAKKADDDDDVDLFASDDEEEDKEAAALKEKRLAEYAAKKAKKPALIAKSTVLLDVKPWDDETKMEELEAAVRTIVMDGLLWGSSKLIPVGYGIRKLQITTVIEDDKVSVEELTEKIEAIEEFVQSVDIAAFNKI